MWVASRPMPGWMLIRIFEGLPPADYMDRFLPSIREALTAMGIWLP